MKKLFSIALLLVATLASVPAQATSIYSFALSGANQVPPITISASGNGTMTLADDLRTLAVSFNFSGLTGGPLMMGHIHCCAPSTANAPVALNFAPFPAVTSGSYSRTFDIGASGTLINGVTQSALVTALNTGNAYVNLHTAVYPDGEIRGQIVSSPEPATWGLLALSFAGGLGARFLRKRVA